MKNLIEAQFYNGYNKVEKKKKNDKLDDRFNEIFFENAYSGWFHYL